MNEREMLELAAKAVGLHLVGYDEISKRGIVATEIPIKTLPVSWCPHEDDGDALRLAVKLKLHIGLEDNTVSVWHREEFGNFQTERLMDRGDAAATRRAIVRAAAEVGKAMP